VEKLANSGNVFEVFVKYYFSACALRGRGQGGSPSPCPAKNNLFLYFFERNSIFFGVFKANSMFLPPSPLENFALYWMPMMFS
jgi:hypothetical protein